MQDLDTGIVASLVTGTAGVLYFRPRLIVKTKFHFRPGERQALDRT